MEWLAVGIGGAAGALLRHAVSVRLNGAFPWGTLAVNALGCLVLAAVVSWAQHVGWSKDQLWLRLIGTGGMGALTTYSTFNLELISMVSADRGWSATIYGSSTALLCLALGFAGWALGRFLAPH